MAVLDAEELAEKGRQQEWMEQAVRAANALGHQIGGFYDAVDSGNTPVREAACRREGCDKRVAYYLDDGEAIGDALEGVCCNPNPRYRGRK